MLDLQIFPIKFTENQWKKVLNSHWWWLVRDSLVPSGCWICGCLPFPPLDVTVWAPEPRDSSVGRGTHLANLGRFLEHNGKAGLSFPCLCDKRVSSPWQPLRCPRPILAAWCPRRFWSLPHGAGLPRAASGSLPDEDTRETVACASLSLKQSSGGQSVPYGEVHRQGTEAPISETSSPQLGLLVTAIPSWHHCDHRETLKP